MGNLGYFPGYFFLYYTQCTSEDVHPETSFAWPRNEKKTLFHALWHHFLIPSPTEHGVITL